ncbi:dual specificity protein phosphatase 22 isoform X3 [Gorilla gorilla gorilla]|uniref:dual specificity protein phosphatase 22 isoform X3 n=1 Tax=Gorilla gorilla gorilla TaxID=9595 RepID=UPI0024456856|nr:dual specificity protein phosphatase 22 isoform X3 [Gorilla gorilla gorilla]
MLYLLVPGVICPGLLRPGVCSAVSAGAWSHLPWASASWCVQCCVCLCLESHLPWASASWCVQCCICWTRHFKESIKFIHECRLRGESCLVHCLAGVSRSVTLVIAYIMTVTDFGWEDALHTVRAGRSCANPNVGFQRQLQEFEKHEVHQYRQWLKEEYGESPLQDAEEAKNILAAPGILKFWAFLRRL